MSTQKRVPMRQLSSNLLSHGSPNAHYADKDGYPQKTSTVNSRGVNRSTGRKSMGPSAFVPRLSLSNVAISTAKKKNKTKQRMSMLPATTARRQSTVPALTFGEGPGKNNPAKDGMVALLSSGGRRKSSMMANNRGNLGGILKADPRPLGTKAFMNNGIEMLIEFLVDHKFDQSLSPKILNPPTGKDFENVARFMFNLLDANARRSGKFADEMVTLFKCMRYPFSISKTALAAVGSPHTWPTLLATLVWLVELLRYGEAARLDSEDFDLDFRSPDQEADSDKQFFVYLRHAYAFFLSGDDERHNQLDEERRELFSQELNTQREAIETLRCTKSELQEQRKVEVERPNELARLERKKRDMLSDRTKFDNVVLKYEEHRNILQKKVARDETACRALEREVAEATREKESIQERLEAQEICQSDAERMNLERRRLIDELEQEIDSREKIMDKINDKKKEIQLKCQSIDEKVQIYNRKTRDIRLVQHFDGNCIVQLDPNTSELVAIASNETSRKHKSGSVVPTADTAQLMDNLRDLHQVMHKKLHQLKTENMNLLLQVEKNETEKAHSQSDIHAIEHQLQKLECDFQETKQDMDKELNQRAIETERLEEEIHALGVEIKTTLQPALRNATQQRLQCESSLETLKMENDEIMRRIDETMENGLHCCINNQEEISVSLENLETGLTKSLKRVKQLNAEGQSESIIQERS